MIDCCQEAAKLFPDHLKLKENLLIALFQQKRLDEAEHLIPGFVLQSQESLLAERLLHNLYRSVKNFDTALMLSEKLYEQSPDANTLAACLMDAVDGQSGAKSKKYYKALIAYPIEQIDNKHFPFIYDIARRGNDWETADRFWPAAQQYMIEQAKSGNAVHNIRPLSLISEPRASLPFLKLIHMCYWRDFKQKMRAGWVTDLHKAFTMSLRFRIGIVSDDFCRHVVGYFINAWIKHYDRSRFEIFCYANVAKSRRDSVTANYRSLVDHFVFVDQMQHYEMATKIQEDGIQILIDLTGYTTDSLINMMVYKPAPIIMTWLGYPCTTGCAEVDYVIGDRWLYTSRHSELFVEKMLVLPESCYFVDNYPYAPPRPLLPLNEKGYVTFGTLMNAYKINPEVIKAWKNILSRVENSRFIINHYKLKGYPLENLKRTLENEGFPMERLIIISEEHPEKNHLYHYHDIDIALDTFPQTGGTTTLDTLTMAVPIVSLVGDCLLERISYSLIQNCGLEDTSALLATTVDEYIEKAVALAENQTLLNRIHQQLMENIRSSHIFSAEKMTRQLEAGFLEAWHEQFPDIPFQG